MSGPATVLYAQLISEGNSQRSSMSMSMEYIITRIDLLLPRMGLLKLNLTDQNYSILVVVLGESTVDTKMSPFWRSSVIAVLICSLISLCSAYDCQNPGDISVSPYP